MAKIRRHGLSAILEHWVVALSTLLLIFSGFGQMPMYARYGIASIPGLGWSADYNITLTVHYLAGITLVSIGIYHLLLMILTKNFDLVPKRGDLKESYHIIKAIITGGEEPASDKFLAEQRLAYAFIGFWLIVVGITGIFKVLKNLQAVDFSAAFNLMNTNIHNLATFMILFGFIGHMAAFVVKANRKLLPAIFTGFVDEAYAKHRHVLWYNRIKHKAERKDELSPIVEETAAGYETN